MLILALLFSFNLHAQSQSPQSIERAEKNIPIAKAPHDSEIALRLMRILSVTGWFKDIRVRCQEGVVTLSGLAGTTAQSQWAESLAHDTDEVVAVINNIQIEPHSWLDLTPARRETESLVHRTTGFLPYLVTSLVVFLFFSGLAFVVSHFTRRAVQMRVSNVLTVDLISRLSALPVFIVGFWLVLQICGLTGVAATIIGGTGALGLVAGFAMQNILANYFAGLMLSLRNPYTTGDVITVAGQTGVVQKLTTRGTILVDFDGNHIIIPNSTIYQNIIINASSNPNTRVKFAIEIGYNDLVSKARATILSILQESPGVLKEPEPSVLVTDFLPQSVQIKVFFWIHSADTSGDKLKSLVIEQVKETLQDQGFTLPGALQKLAMTRGTTRMEATTKKPEVVELSNEKQDLLREASKGRDLDHGREFKPKA